MHTNNKYDVDNIQTIQFQQDNLSHLKPASWTSLQLLYVILLICILEVISIIGISIVNRRDDFDPKIVCNMTLPFVNS